MTPRSVPRLGRRRELRIGERPDHHDDDARFVGLRGEDRRAALGAEVKDVDLAVCLVRRPGVVGVAAGDAHLVGVEPRLHAERASRPPLARKAVTDRDRERIARRLDAKLATAAGCLADRHAGALTSSRNTGSSRIGSKSESPSPPPSAAPPTGRSRAAGGRSRPSSARRRLSQHATL